VIIITIRENSGAPVCVSSLHICEIQQLAFVRGFEIRLIARRQLTVLKQLTTIANALDLELLLLPENGFQVV